MKRLILLVSVTLLSAFGVTSVSAEETLDTLLPPPSWLRSRAEELNIDGQTRQDIEQTYKEKEPKYHENKYKVERLTGRLYTALVADELDEEMIVQRMKALLEAESELKLYQVHVRISLLSQVSSEQRRAARELAKRKTWRGGMAAQVERMRQLSKRLKDSGESVTEIEKRMKEIDKTVAAGKVTEGARMLSQVIRDLEKSLEK